MDSDVDEPEQGKTHQLTEDRVSHLADVVPKSNLAARLRKSSIGSALTDLSEMEVDAQPTTDVQSAGGSDDCLVGVESDSEYDEGESEQDGDEDDSDAAEDGDQVMMEPTLSTESNQEKKKNLMSADTALASKLATVELRRSSRKKPSSEVLSQSPQPGTPLPLPKIVVMRKPIVRKDRLVDLVSVGNKAIMHKLTTSCSGEVGV
jgi:hypothetical protein